MNLYLMCITPSTHCGWNKTGKSYEPHEEPHWLPGAQHLERKERIRKRGQHMIHASPGTVHFYHVVNWSNESAEMRQLYFSRAHFSLMFAKTELCMSSTFWYLNWDLSTVIKLEGDNVDHVLCEHSDGSLATSWTRTYNLGYYEESPFSARFPLTQQSKYWGLVFYSNEWNNIELF